jgi:hypothetical protein
MSEFVMNNASMAGMQTFEMETELPSFNVKYYVSDVYKYYVLLVFFCQNHDQGILQNIYPRPSLVDDNDWWANVFQTCEKLYML